MKKRVVVGLIAAGLFAAANKAQNPALTSDPTEHEYGTLIVESDRRDAALKIDGEECGDVPRLLLLSPGRHKLFLQAAAAPDKTREVEVRVGFRTIVKINFAGGSPETVIEPETGSKRAPGTRPSPTPAEARTLFALIAQ